MFVGINIAKCASNCICLRSMKSVFHYSLGSQKLSMPTLYSNYTNRSYKICPDMWLLSDALHQSLKITSKGTINVNSESFPHSNTQSKCSDLNDLFGI